MSIVYDLSLEMGSPDFTGTTPFMAPELIVPFRFGLDKYIPSKEADIYAMAMVTYQVRDTIPSTHSH